ncbi:MAG: hypothetical protein JW881_08115, partial [Spirochaetales bacterium]|nr:hypothetical protein [Spirochaetales bacterium]
FLGYTLTWHKRPLLKVALKSIKRLKGKIKEIFRIGRGRSLSQTIQKLKPLLRGWFNYFSLSEVKGIFETLDGWLRRRLRCILWRQWKRMITRARNLMKRGLDESTAWKSAGNGRGAWWNSGAQHMNKAFPKSYFDCLGLYSFIDNCALNRN